MTNFVHQRLSFQVSRLSLLQNNLNQNLHFGIAFPHQVRSQAAVSETSQGKLSPKELLQRDQKNFLQSNVAQLEGQILTGQQVFSLIETIVHSVGKRDGGNIAFYGLAAFLTGGLALLHPAFRKNGQEAIQKTVPPQILIENLALLMPVNLQNPKDNPGKIPYNPSNLAGLSFPEAIFYRLMQLELLKPLGSQQISLNKPISH